jgi:arylamine N-acetyltransferase
MKKRIHDAPWLTVRSADLRGLFCARYGIDPQSPSVALLDQVAAAFGSMPFENLTKIIKAGGVTSPSSAMRYPDELLGDFLRWGTGGTCFSLTASMVAVFDMLGVEAYPVLADRHYGPDTHCGVMVVRNGTFLLCDPGYLLFSPVPIPRDQPAFFDNGFNRVELVPVAGGTRLELYTVVKGNRKLRLTFKVEPVSDDAFARAWERSFAFEMMSYPVLTRAQAGRHVYLQADTLAIRDSHTTRQTVLSPGEQIEFLTSGAGLQRDIVVKALEMVKYGIDSAATVR